MSSDFFLELDRLYEGEVPGAVERYLIEKAQEYGGDFARYIAVLNELGSFYRGEGRYAEAIENFELAKEACYANGRGGELGYAIIINNLAGAYRMNYQSDTALSLFLESLSIYEGLSSYDDYSYASLLNNISLVYEQKGELENAVEYLLRAIAVVEKTDKRGYAISNANLAKIYEMMGKQELAETHSKIAREAGGGE